jgi:acyl-CoA-binding protein
VKQSKNIKDDNMKLKIYGYYKQATLGDCNVEKPQMFDFIGKSKWSAWDLLRGMSKK